MKIRVLKIVTGLMIGLATVFVATQTLATVTSTTTQTISALGNGSTKNFTIGFTFVDNDHIAVYLQDESASPYTRTLLTYGSGVGKYTITGGSGDPGTTVVMGTAPTSAQRVLIKRVTPRTQSVNYDENNAFPFDEHEAQMDRAMYAIQEQDSKIEKTIALSPVSTASPVPTFPDPVANTFVQYDTGGSTLTLSPASPTSGDVLKFDGSAWSKYGLDAALLLKADQTSLDATNATVALKANAVDLLSHTSDTSNPHSVTAAQVGAPTTLDFLNHTTNILNPHSVTAEQVGNSTAQWNANKIIDKDVSLSGASDGKVLTYVAATDSLALTPAPLAPTLTEAHLFVGDSTSNAVDTAVSGDISLVASGAMTVNTVGGATAANIATASTLANAATEANTPSTVVKRDANGDFAASTITATSFIGALTGNVTGNASTASALAANPSACSAGQYVSDIAADGTLTCGAVDALPTQTGNSGKYLRTDGSTVGWSTVDALPTQTGNTGKYLTTDGTSASWAAASGSSKNFVANPSANSDATTSVTASGLTPARDTDAADAIGGIASFNIPSATSGQYLCWDINTLDSEVTGNCQADLNYKGDASKYSFDIVTACADASPLHTVALTNETGFRTAQLNYPCGAYKLRVRATDTASTAINVGAWFGKATNLSQVSQAKVVGTWTMTTATNCAFSTASGSYTDFTSDDTDCSNPVVTGSVTSNGKKPSFVVSGPGDYEVSFSGIMINENTADRCAFALSIDGSTPVGPVSNIGSGGVLGMATTLLGTFNVTDTAAKTVRVIAVRMGGSTANCTIVNNVAAQKLSFIVKKFPTSTQTAVTVDQTIDYTGSVTAWASTCPSGTIPATNKTIGLSGADYSGATYYRLYAYLWDVASASAGSPYKLSTTKGASAAADWAAAKTIAIDFSTNELFLRQDGSNTTLGGYQADDIKGHTHTAMVRTSNADMSLSGATSFGQYDQSGQYLGNSGAATNAGPATSSTGGTETRPKNVAVNYCVNYSGVAPQPVLPNQVSTSASGGVRVEAARIQTNGASCALTRQVGNWISGLASCNTGVAVINFVAGTWSAAPVCTCTSATGTANGSICQLSDPSTSAVTLSNYYYNAGSATPVNDYHQITCVGPR